MSTKKIGIDVGSQFDVRLGERVYPAQVTHMGVPSEGWVMLTLDIDTGHLGPEVAYLPVREYELVS